MIIHWLKRVKKTPLTVDNLTESEARKKLLIHRIQEYKQEGCSVTEISRRTGKDRRSVIKYLSGNPDILCRSNRVGVLEPYKDFIIKCLKDGMTQAETILLLRSRGYSQSDTNARTYFKQIIKELDIQVKKYNSSANTRPMRSGAGAKGNKFDYITRKGIFQHLWMGVNLNEYHRKYIFDKYPILYELEKCVHEFRAVFERKSIIFLYLFIDRYKNSDIKEIVTFASGLERDIEAVENAVASDLSNGFVEGTNSKLKMIKRTMYGRCGLKLLSAKLMYRPSSNTYTDF